MGKVRIIPQTINPLTQVKIGTIKKKKVAAYARVSTDQEEQESSFDAQVQHFTEHIKSRDDWEFVKVYSDEGYIPDWEYMENFIKSLPFGDRIK